MYYPRSCRALPGMGGAILAEAALGFLGLESPAHAPGD